MTPSALCPSPNGFTWLVNPIRLAVEGLLLLSLAADASAQAFVPGKGEATVAVSFQNISIKEHALPVERFDAGRISSNTLLVDISYSLTKKLVVDFGLPYVTSSYKGPFPHDPNVFGFQGQRLIDDGKSHGTFQDLRFGVRYNLIAGRLSITPFVGSIVPSHDYTFYAHSAVGRRVRELAVGTYVAKLLDPVVPRTFIQARYSYSFAQRVLDIPHNHSNLDLEIGYFINPTVRVFALGSGQVTHGGVDLTIDNFRPSPFLAGHSFNDLELHHDQIDRANFLNLGGGAAVSLSDSVDLFGSFVKAVAVRNGHAVNRGITLGLAWTLPRAGGQRAVRQTRTDDATRSLVRCVCQRATS